MMRISEILLENEVAARYLGPSGYMTLYHTSPRRFEQFAPFSHFGTEDAAWDRAVWLRDNQIDIDDPLYWYEVKINVNRSIEILDKHQNHSIEEVYMSVAELLDEMDCLAQEGDIQGCINHMHEMDARFLWYRNAFEDVGSISFIVVDPADIQIVTSYQLDI